MSGRIIVMVVSVGLCAGSVFAATVSVDFNGHQGAEGGGTFTAAGPLGGGVWNGLDVDLDSGHAPISFTGLVDALGSPTGVSIGLDNWYEADYWTGGSYANDLYNDYLVQADNVGEAFITIGGLVPDERYDLAVFTSNDGGDFGAVVSVNGRPARTAVGGATTPMFLDGLDMLLFTEADGLAAEADSSGTVVLSVTGERPLGSLQSVINGLQIRLVPDPATGAVVLLGAASLLGRRRRVNRG